MSTNNKKFFNNEKCIFLRLYKIFTKVSHTIGTKELPQNAVR